MFSSTSYFDLCSFLGTDDHKNVNELAQKNFFFLSLSFLSSCQLTETGDCHLLNPWVAWVFVFLI